MRNSLFRTVSVVIIIILVTSSLFGCASSNGSSGRISLKNGQSFYINDSELEQIVELSTIHSTVHLSGDGTKQNTILWGAIKTSEDRVFFEYDAEFDVGVEIGSVKTNQSSKKITVELSKPKMLNSKMIESSIEKYPFVVIDKNGIIQSNDEITAEKITELRGIAQEMLNEKINEQQINFNIAQQNAKKLIQEYFDNLTDGQYTVVFVEKEG